MIQFKNGHHKVQLLVFCVCGLQRTCHANGCCAEAKQSQSRRVNAPGRPANQALECTEIREGFPLPSLFWSKCDQNPPITKRGSAGLPWAPGLVPRVPGLCCAAGPRLRAGSSVPGCWAPRCLLRIRALVGAAGFPCARCRKRKRAGPAGAPRQGCPASPADSRVLADSGGTIPQQKNSEKIRRVPLRARRPPPGLGSLLTFIWSPRTEAGSSSRVTAEPCVTVACNRRAPCNRRV